MKASGLISNNHNHSHACYLWKIKINKYVHNTVLALGLTNYISQSTHRKVGNDINGYGNMWLCGCMPLLLTACYWCWFCLLSNAEPKFCSKHLLFWVDFKVNSFSHILSQRDNLNHVCDFVTWLRIQWYFTNGGVGWGRYLLNKESRCKGWKLGVSCLNQESWQVHIRYVRCTRCCVATSLSLWL